MCFDEITKRNRLFILAYIVFIFGCVVVRFFWDFPMWNTFVVAITVASMWLSIADFLKTQSSIQKRIVDTYDDYTMSSLDEIQMIKKAIGLRLKQSDTYQESTFLSVEEQISHHETQLSRIEDMEKRLCETKKAIKRYKKNAACMCVVSSVMYLVGFLSLFSIIVFEPLATRFSKHQDVLTVMAFGTILLTQLIDEVLNDYYSKSANKEKALLDAMDALRQSYESEVLHNAD